jgi:hypothetical protein
MARGLTEMAYAAALGERERVPITAADAASRHDFGFNLRPGRRASWEHPTAGSGLDGRWHVTGAVLGLDVALAAFSLVRPSSRAPARAPMLNEVDRRVFTETLALVEPAALEDADRDRIVAAIRRGRARLVAARTPEDAGAIADDLGLSAPHRTLLSWTVAHDPGRVSSFLSPVELLWLGLGDDRMGTLHAWGAPAGPRQGCLCLRLAGRGPWDTVAGRWHAGLLGSVVPDLNLRLAELLSELRMPAALLGPVLASATLEFVESAISRDPDDRRGLVEFVQSLRVEHLEQYLALLTADGPLVPIRSGAPEDGDALHPGAAAAQGAR